MNVSLDGVYASNPTIGDDHPPNDEHFATKAATKNES
jgi:hypothetical protein